MAAEPARRDPDSTMLLLDVMCGGIRSVLRMVGYDTVYALDRNVEADDAVRAIAVAEGRILITRDRSLAASTAGSLLVESKAVDGQLAELAAAGFELTLDDPARCSRCNGTLETLEGDDTTPDYAPDPGEEPTWRCRDCGQVYWRGSHWDDVRARLAALEGGGTGP